MRGHAWQTAASLAARAHRHQLRKDGVTPYIAHPARVALTVALVFGCRDEAAIAAALLHDVIEDASVDFDEVEEGAGREVASIVAALTKNMALPEAEREAEYDRRLAGADWRARLIKLADCYDNLSDRLPGRGLSKPRERSRRAIRLALPDARAHPETARAIAAVRERLRGAR